MLCQEGGVSFGVVCDDVVAVFFWAGGESASGGAKGEWGRVRYGVVSDVVVFFFWGELRRVSFGVVCDVRIVRDWKLTDAT